MTIPLEIIFNYLLTAAGAGHFLVLIASFQVPSRLNWKEDLARLTPFNRKLMWVYGGFTIMTIAAFGILTLLFQREMAAGNGPALGLAGFIGIFWLARILVNVFYFSDDDWPAGNFFIWGHRALMGLFIFLCGTYLGVIIWKCL